MSNTVNKEEIIKYVENIEQFSYKNFKTKECLNENVKPIWNDIDDVDSSCLTLEFRYENFPEWKFGVWGYGYDNDHIDTIYIFTQNVMNIDKFKPSRSVFCCKYRVGYQNHLYHNAEYELEDILSMLKTQPYIAWYMDMNETKAINFDIKDCKKEYLRHRKEYINGVNKHKKKLTKIHEGLKEEIERNVNLLKKLGCPYKLCYCHEYYGIDWKPTDEELSCRLYVETYFANKYLKKTFNYAKHIGSGNYDLSAGIGKPQKDVIFIKSGMFEYFHIVIGENIQHINHDDTSFYQECKIETFDGKDTKISIGKDYKEYNPNEIRYF
ncbi:MAG: hypothetical protein MJZ34_08385 [Paludibacteraceae bacterium]|nr:hypothetical protein [Paludibacteraceae bacterium]